MYVKQKKALINMMTQEYQNLKICWMKKRFYIMSLKLNTQLMC